MTADFPRGQDKFFENYDKERKQLINFELGIDPEKDDKQDQESKESLPAPKFGFGAHDVDNSQTQDSDTKTAGEIVHGMLKFTINDKEHEKVFKVNYFYTDEDITALGVFPNENHPLMVNAIVARREQLRDEYIKTARSKLSNTPIYALDTSLVTDSNTESEANVEPVVAVAHKEASSDQAGKVTKKVTSKKATSKTKK